MLTNSIINDIKYWIRYGNMVTRLILVNVAIFLPLAFLNVGSHAMESFWLHNLIIGKIGVPASWQALLYQPWSVLTYMFAHEDIFHVVFNMLTLYFFGEIFVLFLGDGKVLPLYILGGLAGALIYVLAFNLFPGFAAKVSFTYLIGASASIYAIVFAAATLSPDYEMRLILLGNVRIKWIAVGALLLGLLAIPKGNAGGYISHLGGAIVGYLYIKALQSGVRVSNPFNGSKSSKNVKLTYRSNVEKTPENKARTNSEQARIDEILDKITRSGYDSLTKEEKDFLFHYSKK